MAKKRLSMQERMRQRRSSRFVGREQQLELFKQNLDRSPADENYYFIFNVYGQGGVGKTTLVKQYEQIAKDKGHIAAYTDESVASSVDYMHRVARELEKQRVKLKSFQKRYEVYLRERKQLEAHPDAPKGFMDLLGRSVAKAGMVAAREFIPGANAAMEYIDFDDETLVKQAGSWASHVKSFIGNKDEVELVLRPEAVLTPLWLDDLSSAVEEKKGCLIIDTFEESHKQLENWLLLLLKGEYGDVPENVQFIVAGRSAFHATLWSDFAPFTTSIPLEPFSDIAARNFLKDKGINDEAVIDAICSLSGNLPVWLDTLGDEAAKGSLELEDPSGKAVDRYLKWIKDPQRRRLVLEAALPRYLDQDIVAILFSKQKEVEELFEWISTRPFVQLKDGKWHYHDIVRTHINRLSISASPEKWSSVNDSLAEYFNTKMEKLSIQNTQEAWLNDIWREYNFNFLYHLIRANYPKNSLIVLKSVIRSLQFGKLLQTTIRIIQLLKDQDALSTYTPKRINIEEGWLKEYRYGNYDNTLKLTTELWRARDILDPSDRGFIFEIEGDYYSSKNEYDLAITKYQEAIALKPDSTKARLEIGKIYNEQKKFQQAIESFKKLIKVKNDHQSAWFELAALYKTQEEYKEAIECYTQLAKYNPDHHLVWYMLGDCWYLQKDADKAALCYKKALSVSKNYINVYKRLGRRYNLSNEHKKAINSFLYVIRVDPKDIEAWYIIGDSSYKEKNHEVAIKCCNEVLRLSPKHDKAWVLLGLCQQAIGDHAEADKSFNTALELGSSDEGIWFYLGVNAFLSGNYEKATEAYNKSLELNPGDIDSLWGIGNSWYSLKEYKKAAVYFEEYLEVESDYKIWDRLGDCLYYQENYEDAIKAYEEVLALEPALHYTWHDVGNCWFSLEDYVTAKEKYERALKIKPDYDIAWYSMGNCHYNLKEYDKAIQCYLKAVEINSDYHEAWYWLGESYYRKQKYPEAIDSYDSAINLSPNSYTYWCEKGYSYYLLKDYAQAISCFDRTIQIKSDYTRPYELKIKALFDQATYQEIPTIALQAIDIAPENLHLRHSLGWAHLLLDNISEAKKYLLICWNESNSQYAPASANLGHIQLFEGDTNGAIAFYRAGIILHPDKNAVFQELTEDYVKLNMSKKGIPRPQYDQLLQDLRDWYDQQPKD